MKQNTKTQKIKLTAALAGAGALLSMAALTALSSTAQAQSSHSVGGVGATMIQESGGAVTESPMSAKPTVTATFYGKS